MTGVAEITVLQKGTTLYHGSPAGEFTHEYLQQAGPSPYHYQHPPTPGSPAWFATNPLFSLHAAARFTKPNAQWTITLHTYRVSKDINLMSFQDMDDFRAFMSNLMQVKPTYNGKKEAIPLARQAAESGLDGYLVLKDIVRDEPEYVLFESGLNKLTNPDPFTMRLVPVPGSKPPASRFGFDNNPTGATVATYQYTGGPGTLI
jgi:hypothetical protein